MNGSGMIFDIGRAAVAAVADGPRAAAVGPPVGVAGLRVVVAAVFRAAAVRPAAAAHRGVGRSCVHPMNETDHASIAEAIRAGRKPHQRRNLCGSGAAQRQLFLRGRIYRRLRHTFAAVLVAVAAHWYWFTVPLPVFGLAILAAFLTRCCSVALARHHIWLVPRAHPLQAGASQCDPAVSGTKCPPHKQRTGILLFVSLAERYAEVVADAGINAKVHQDEWNDIVAILTEHADRDDLTAMVSQSDWKSGPAAGRTFPSRVDDINELDDHLVEL